MSLLFCVTAESLLRPSPLQLHEVHPPTPSHPRPLCKIPCLAIHLESGDERSAFKPNKEQHLRPILASHIYNQLSGVTEPETETDLDQAPGDVKTRHYWGLLNLISESIKVPVEDILELDFSFYDTQGANLFGLNEEFVSSPRLDNQFSTYFAIRSLCESSPEGQSFINMVCAFDHEEIGSKSHQGANSKFTSQICSRIFEKLDPVRVVENETYDIALRKSFIISADMAHAIHPNYASRHQRNHQPKLNEGIVLKTNVNQRYMTDSHSGSIIRLLGKMCDVPINEFVVKNDSPCGSTIGGFLASWVSAKTVDIGGAQWAMHSCRETCGIMDSVYYLDLFSEFFKSYETIDHSWNEK